MRIKLKVNRRQQLLTGILVFLLFCSLSQALNPDKKSNEYQVGHWDLSRGFPIHWPRESPPPVIIEKVFFNQMPVSLPLPLNANTFTAITELRFHFNAITLLSAKKVTFKYQLEGFDQQWTFLSPGKKRTALYKNLEPGTYTFNVTAGNSEGTYERGSGKLFFV